MSDENTQGLEEVVERNAFLDHLSQLAIGGLIGGFLSLIMLVTAPLYVDAAGGISFMAALTTLGGAVLGRRLWGVIERAVLPTPVWTPRFHRLKEFEHGERIGLLSAADAKSRKAELVTSWYQVG